MWSVHLTTCPYAFPALHVAPLQLQPGEAFKVQRKLPFSGSLPSQRPPSCDRGLVSQRRTFVNLAVRTLHLILSAFRGIACTLDSGQPSKNSSPSISHSVTPLSFRASLLRVLTPQFSSPFSCRHRNLHRCLHPSTDSRESTRGILDIPSPGWESRIYHTQW
ncbi:hypothetical protein KP509_12G053500 [Ceratopteris richardii]|uniref:Uncharacterized protein n=1 Tax=Ceratopteris richardii TaxID=49495 RepID=A0A8T2TNW7_CERRI|nr:hypothetical protein KP509_12G053500 [Ceratopteris richardii]